MDAADKLRPKQEALIAALLTAQTVQAAAMAAGVSDSTARRWLRDDAAFQAVYMLARRQAVQQGIARLQQVSSQAVDRLKNLLTCGKPAIELGAARTILEFSIKAVEIEDIAARLAALEERYAQKL